MKPVTGHSEEQVVDGRITVNGVRRNVMVKCGLDSSGSE